MISFISEFLWFYVLKAIFHKITMTFNSFEKHFCFLIKKKIKVSFTYDMKSEIHCKGFSWTDQSNRYLDSSI